MSSGFTPPPWKPPDPPSNQLNPLAILNLLQQKQEMEMRQKAMDEQRAQNATEQFLKAVESGMDPEVAAQNTPGLGVPGYNLGLETAKQLKKQNAAKQALSPQSLASVSQAAGGTISPRNEWVPPTEENLAATRQTYSSLPDLLGPESGYAAQTVLNQLVGGAQAEQQQRAAASRAGEAQTRRTASYQEGLQREGTRISQERGARLSDEAGRRALDRDHLAEIYAVGDAETIRRAEETILAGSPPAEAKRLIQRAAMDGDAVRAKKRLAERTSPGAGEFAVTDALKQWNEGIRSPDVIATLQAKKLIMENPSPPRTLAVDPRTRWLWVEGQEQSIKGLTQMRGIDGMLNRLEDFAYAAEGDPKQFPMLHGITGSQAMEMVNRGTAREGTLVASIGTILVELQKTFASVGNVGQITDFEQMMAARMGPWKTEILGADGNVSEGFKGRLAAGRDMVERARIAAVDPQVRAQLEQETKAYLSHFNPEQRAALKAYAGAATSGDTAAMVRAEKRMQKTGATDIGNRLNFRGDTKDRARAEAEADAAMGIGPAGGAK